MINFLKNWLQQFKKIKPSKPDVAITDNKLPFNTEEELFSSRGESSASKRKKVPGADTARQIVTFVQ